MVMSGEYASREGPPPATHQKGDHVVNGDPTQRVLDELKLLNENVTEEELKGKADDLRTTARALLVLADSIERDDEEAGAEALSEAMPVMLRIVMSALMSKVLIDKAAEDDSFSLIDLLRGRPGGAGIIQ